MILQREMPIPIWGTSEPQAELQISFDTIQLTVQANAAGQWDATFPSMKAGGSYQLVIKGESSTVTIQDIYIGEVWICSGQSNMEWSLAQAAKGKIEVAMANNPRIRFFHLKKKHDTYNTPYSSEQLEEFSAGKFFSKPSWKLCSSETSAAFSAVAYFFGKALHDSLDVPIGLIQAAVGGSPCQSWIGREALASHPQLRHLVDADKLWTDSQIIHPWLVERAQQNWGNLDLAKETTLPGHPFAPSYLFESVIQTIAPYPIRGAIWYQGESNATHPQSYIAMMDMLLSSWRKAWKQGDFPFYFVQLPKIGNRSLWPEFREAQQQGLDNPNTAMVVTLDQGHPTDVHPQKKEVVGLRLARIALAKTYERDIAAESPYLLSYDWKRQAHEVTMSFTNTYKGLKTQNKADPEGFYLHGYLNEGTSEVVIIPKHIHIADDEITFSYPAGFMPVSIKYGWAPYPETNVVNSADLPLAPFRIELPGTN